MTRPGACPVCPDPTCPVREGTFASAYHAIDMVRDAYRMNGTPRSDRTLMGLHPDKEPKPRRFPAIDRDRTPARPDRRCPRHPRTGHYIPPYIPARPDQHFEVNPS